MSSPEKNAPKIETDVVGWNNANPNPYPNPNDPGWLCAHPVA